jgi:hypothetical protein
MPKIITDLAHFEGLGGWSGEDAAKEAFQIIGGTVYDNIKNIGSFGAGERKMMLYEVVRKVLGQDTLNYRQETGDCTSFGAKNALEYLTCVDIILGGEASKFRPVFPPFIYGAGRVWVTGMRWGQGCTGVGVKEACRKYGVLFSDEEGVPKYNGSIAGKWGWSGPPKNFADQFAKNYLLKDAAKVANVQEAFDNIFNGRPVTLASDWGFNFRADKDGFMAPRGTWNHQMALVGAHVGSSHGDYGIILNSWGDVFEHLKDFDTNVDLPIGVLRVRAEYIDKMIKQNDSWAYTNFEEYPDNEAKINKELFKIIGS